MNAVDVFLNCMNGKFGPTVTGILRGVDRDQALWRPASGWVNVREIALHVAHWENALANRLTETKRSLGLQCRKTGWVRWRDELTDEEWGCDLAIVAKSHARMIDAMRAFDGERLHEVVGKNTDKSAFHHVLGIAIHSAHHVGRIKMLKELYVKQIAERGP